MLINVFSYEFIDTNTDEWFSCYIIRHNMSAM